MFIFVYQIISFQIENMQKKIKNGFKKLILHLMF